jgi:ribosome recycling factor
MSALARPARLLSRTMLSSVHTSRHATPLLAMRVQRRTYAAKKGKGAQSANAFVPGSQLVSADPAAIAEHARCGERMAAAVAWYRKEVAGAEARAAGRVTPALLAPVRVVLPGGGEPVRLDEVATVGVREGTTLLITVFEEAVRRPRPCYVTRPVADEGDSRT